MHPSNPQRPLHSTKKREAGFTLAEVAVALAIFSFALVSMLGLLSVGLKTSRKANLQTAAANLLSSIASDISASMIVDDEDPVLHTHTYTYKSPVLGLNIVRTESDGKITVSPATMILTDGATDASSMQIQDQGILKLFKVNFTPPADNAVGVRVSIVWPHNAPPGTVPEGSMESILSLPVR